MSEDLSNKKCIPCEGGIPAFDIDQINNFLKKVDNWSAKEDEKDKFYLIKEFNFKNFVDSQDFVNKVGDLAEIEGHHPDISFGLEIMSNFKFPIFSRDIREFWQKFHISMSS